MPPRRRTHTIEDFLSTRRSKGPREPPGGSFKQHDAADMDIMFLVSLLEEGGHSLSKISCIPDARLCLYQHASRHDRLYVAEPSRRACRSPRKGYRIIFDIRAGLLVTLHPRPQLWLPAKLDDAIQRCRTRRKRFVIFNFGVYVDSLTIGHSNALILDLEERIIERYDPAGLTHEEAPINQLLSQAFPSFRYVGATAGPRQGVQRRGADAFEGLCVTFSTMYVLMRLLHPHLAKRQVESLMIDGSPRALRRRALQLNATMVETLRRRPAAR